MATMQGKKFISPGAWFSLVYPASWNEFEDTEDTFLFYNPNKWTGNFRISAYKAEAKAPDARNYGKNAARDELEQNSQAELVKVGVLECAYSKETFQEEGEYYVSHLWVTGIDNIAFECSFTVPRGETDVKQAEEIIASLQVRKENAHYPQEIIPIRVLEINEVNEAYEWASSNIKKVLKKDFTASAEDIAKIHQVMKTGNFKLQQRAPWEAFGIAFGAILVNEIDGMEWVTVIDGNREFAALRFRDTDVVVYPAGLVWNKVRNGEKCDLQKEFEKIKEEVEKVW